MRNLLLFSVLLSIHFISAAQSIQDLDFLIGKWQLHEVTYPGTPKEYIETGTRQCNYTMQNTYILCESKAVRHGKDRIYQFLINHVEDDRFQMVSLFSDYSQQGKAVLYLDSKESKIYITSLPGDFQDDSITRSVISFENKSKLVWEGWSSSFKGPVNWNLLYRETATKEK